MNYFYHASINIINNKLRTMLALIGIMIGTASIVSMLSTGLLATNAFLKQYMQLGSNLMLVNLPNSTFTDKITANSLMSYLSKYLNLNIAPFLQTSPKIYFYLNKIQGNVVATTNNFASILPIQIKNGRFISALDHNEMFCILGSDIANQIEKKVSSPFMGSYLQIDNSMFKIIGILSHQPRNIFLPLDINKTIFIPLQSTKFTQSSENQLFILLKIPKTTDLKTKEKTIQNNIIKKIQQAKNKKNIFILTPEALIDNMTSQKKTLNILFATAGIITLLVGGIGIMNITLISVMERKQEIGIRLALGSSAKQICYLFLVESVLISLIGGIIGIIIGNIISYAIGNYFHWPLKYFWSPTWIALLSSCLIGILSGLYPAIKAAKLKPIQALNSN